MECPAGRARARCPAEHRHVALQTGADEVLAPCQAVPVARGQVAVREASTLPQPLSLHPRVFHFKSGEGRQIEVGDATGECFARLAQQVDRRRTQDEKPARALPLCRPRSMTPRSVWNRSGIRWISSRMTSRSSIASRKSAGQSAGCDAHFAHGDNGLGRSRLKQPCRRHQSARLVACRVVRPQAGGGGSPKASGTTGSAARNIVASSSGRSRSR